MRALACLGIPVAAITVLTAGAANATGTIPISAVLRDCDFSVVQTRMHEQRTVLGRGDTQISTTGSSATAQVHMSIADHPGSHYDIGLIQEPRPASATCGPGDPGTTFSGLDTDGSGEGHVTISAPLRQGATGVWVIIESGNPHDQGPSEYYTSEFLAPV